MRGTNSQTLRWVEGRRPGSRVPRVDAGALNREPFAVGTNGFTVAIWFRKNGAGTMRGNAGSENGTLFSVGSGYWDGLRITTDCRRRTVGFEIGQAKPLHSVGIVAGQVPDGMWQHVASTWDGKEMRLYINGLLAMTGVHAAPFVKPPPGARMRIGYANHGIGSVVLDVAEVSVHGRALRAEEVPVLAFGEAVNPDAAKRLASAGEAIVRGDADRAESGFRQVAEDHGKTSGVRALALRGLAKALAMQRRHREATLALLEVMRTAGLGRDVALGAKGELLDQLRLGAGDDIPADVLDGLLDMPGLVARDRVSVLRQLVVKRCAAGDFSGARGACAAWLEASTGGERGRSDAILAMGHVGMEAKDYGAARDAYSRIAHDESAPASFRAIALLRIGESYANEGDVQKAIAAFSAVSKLPGVYRHLVEEARERTGEAAGERGSAAAALRIAAPRWPEPGWRLFVATNGSDLAAGTAEAPFASLARARDEIRARRAKGELPGGGVHVVVGGGEYLVTNTFHLGAQDSGTAGSPVVYRAADGEMPRFRGGVRVRGFEPVRDRAVLERLPESARGKVMRADLRGQGVNDFGKFDPGGYASGGGFGTRPLLELYWNGEPMRVASWPNEGWARTGEMLGEASKDSRGRTVYKNGRFHFADERAARWVSEREAYLYGYWFHDWADSYDRVAKIDPKEKTIQLSAPLHRYGYRAGARFRAVNLLSEIDVPGEYYLDRGSGVLYFLPPSDPEKGVAEITMLETPFMELQGVSHLSFERLTWELGRGDGIRAKGGGGLLFLGCTVRALGGDAILLDGGKGHGLLSCDIAYLGRGGIVLKGGDRKTLESGGHFVENCHIHHFSRIHPTYTPAIHASGVGARIRHNLMHDSGSSALRIEGNDHVTEFNEVHHVVMESDDQGGIDMFGNPTYRGNIHRWNYWHDIGTEFAVGQAGIRLDDAISGTLIYGNVFYRTGGGNFGGVQIHGGKDNIVDNNIFVDCPAAISFSSWGEKRWLESLDGPDTLMAKALNEIDIARPPYSTAYPDLARLREGADANRIWRNVVWNCGEFLRRGRDDHELLDNWVTASDPGFMDAAGGDWRLKPDAPVFRRTAFRAIPFAEIGLYRDAYRKALP
ncbi:MAG TPA: right-handed parallel beta-helix repeat-containing protein [Verrucomicrobiae bacterium]|nr:right-handed parallel beta-helix repeat-containing protein [Verrucomicrobiae bacterium]